MLVSQQMARETNITNHTTGLTLKQHRGTLHKKARKWTEKSLSLYQAEWRVWREDEHKCSIISTAFRRIVREHFLPWKHANFSLFMSDLHPMPHGIDETCIHYSSLRKTQGLTAVDLLQKEIKRQHHRVPVMQLNCTQNQTALSHPPKLWLALKSGAVTRVRQTAVCSESEWQERQFSQVSCEVKAWRGPTYSLLWLRSSITSAQIFSQQREVTSVRHLVDSAGAVSTCYAVSETLEATADSIRLPTAPLPTTSWPWTPIGLPAHQMYLQLVTVKYILSRKHSTAAQSEPLEQGKPKMAAWLHYLGIALVSKHQVHHSSQKRGTIEIPGLHSSALNPFPAKK